RPAAAAGTRKPATRLRPWARSSRPAGPRRRSGRRASARRSDPARRCVRPGDRPTPPRRRSRAPRHRARRWRCRLRTPCHRVPPPQHPRGRTGEWQPSRGASHSPAGTASIMPPAGTGCAAATCGPAAVECRRIPPAGMGTPGDEGMRSEWTLAWLAALLFVAALPCAAQTARPALELADGRREIQLSPYVGYRQDAGAVDEAADAFRRVAGGEFMPLPDGQSEFGFQPGAYWFHAIVRNENQGETRWVLVQQYALSDFFDLYVRYPDGRVIHHASGDHRPFGARSIRDRPPHFLLDLPPGQPVELLVRVQSESSMQVPLAILTQTAFAERARDAQFAIGIYYGILLALFFYNLVLWLMLRDSSYFWYLFHLSAFGM